MNELSSNSKDPRKTSNLHIFLVEYFTGWPGPIIVRNIGEAISLIVNDGNSLSQRIGYTTPVHHIEHSVIIIIWRTINL